MIVVDTIVSACFSAFNWRCEIVQGQDDSVEMRWFQVPVELFDVTRHRRL